MNNLTHKLVHNFFILLLCSSLIISCKVFHDPISLNEAANNTEKGYYKVTMHNGDEYIYERIELNSDNNYIGFLMKNKKPTETILKNEEIKSIQKQNKKSSGFSNILGFGVGIGSILLGIYMF
ncbi:MULTISPECIES: hypothetical protein [Flavobacteriaceae]|uniref:Lipoprotein n=2 Tax=Flavobacteriaceae TaxID=49546 RepID=A0A4Y8ASK5_9FLAO|nr:MULTISPECIES: hypothetical protein [Flavobacteriaceae]TEW74838.1 hypothetical protein E2488_04745 [Gramella jeungdoensis]GGK43592.1 hypothetical protein GCM10007963_09730 [Lutibacter litoralis]